MSRPSSDFVSSANGGAEDNIFGAIGAVLGYIGAEAATEVTFERLLWPHRYYSNFKLSSVPAVALLTTMSGPKHKVALSVLDTIFHHGLFKGAHQGHMLGTSFFPQQDGLYTMHGNHPEQKPHTEPVRNCLWTRAINCLPMLPVTQATDPQSLGNVEKGMPRKGGMIRARVAVSHVTISKASTEDKNSNIPFVSEDTTTPSLRVFLAILTSELPGIVTAVGVFAAFRSAWGLLWLCPVIIRVLSACFSLHREKLVSSISSSSSTDPMCDFEIHSPQSDGNFMLLSGSPTLVLQFFRHYGHPKRDRFREVGQIFAIVLFICLFPTELLCSMIWMPESIQYVWLSYNLFVVVAMHVARYSYIGNSTTTETQIADSFAKHVGGGRGTGGDRECSILFGHQRHGPQTLRIDLSVTYHGRNKGGKEQLEALLRKSSFERQSMKI